MSKNNRYLEKQWLVQCLNCIGHTIAMLLAVGYWQWLVGWPWFQLTQHLIPALPPGWQFAPLQNRLLQRPVPCHRHIQQREAANKQEPGWPAAQGLDKELLVLMHNRYSLLHNRHLLMPAHNPGGCLWIRRHTRHRESIK